jgi:OmpA-OmpF porin, OOP family
VRSGRASTGRAGVALAAALTVTMGLAACSDDAPNPPKPTSPTSVQGSATPTGAQNAGSAPAWQQQVNFDSSSAQPRPTLVKVYPLQRLDGRLLLTADIVAQGTTGQKLLGNNYFCRCNGATSMQDVSLVDTTDRVRYGPLRMGSASGRTYASTINYIFQPVGTTYRIGAFFPDPGPSVTTMGVDLQQAGIAPAIPIVDGGQPAAGLVSGTVNGTVSGGPGTTGTETGGSVAAGPAPTATSPNGGDNGGPLVTWSVPPPGSDAYVDQHDLIAKVVGGTVNKGGNRKTGVVTLNADVLFAFDSAKLSGKAAALINEARSILTSSADESKPVAVTGYTDSKGTPQYNQSLSTRRAQAAATALRSRSLGSIKLQVTGRGEADPVARNTRPDGSDSPAGRALNRRVEITYTPKQAPIPTTEAAAPQPSASIDPSQIVSLPAATVKGNGVAAARMAATVQPIREDGTLSLVSVDITAEQDTLLIDAFTSHSKANQDIGIFRITDPATKRVYIPAYDSGDPYRVMGTYTHRLPAGQAAHFAFYAGALPGSASAVDVDLDQLGTARNVPVIR